MSSPLSVVIGTRNVTDYVDEITFSNVDPGGFELCTISLRKGPVVVVGQRVTVYCGLSVAWDGRVNDPGSGNIRARLVEGITAVGYGAALKDNPAQAFYTHSDLRAWFDSRLEGGTILTTGTSPTVVTGQRYPYISYPANILSINSSSAGIMIDTGIAGAVKYVYVNYNRQTARGNISIGIDSSPDGLTWTSQASTNFAASGNGNTLTATLSPGTRYIRVVLGNVVGGNWTDAADIFIRPTVIQLFGDSTADYQVASSSVLLPTFVALDAMARCNTAAGQTVIAKGPVDVDATNYYIQHLLYPTPTTNEQIIDDAMKSLGWHWGVWEGAGLDNPTPRLFLTAPPATPTIAVRRVDCEEFDPPKVRLDALYDSADVTYHDTAGLQGISTATLANALLAQSGIGSRKLSIDMGTGSAGAATALGNFALSLAQAAQRGGGSALVPGMVMSGAGRRPAELIRAGRDRIRITDLPDPGPLHETDTRRFDTFRVRRVETTLRDSVPQTRVEFDGGADLLEVLQARLADATQLAGG